MQEEAGAAMPTTRTVSLVLATALAMAPLAACAQPQASSTTEQAEAEAKPDALAEAWVVSAADLNGQDALAAQDRTLFESASNTYAPRTFVPYLLLATRGDKDMDRAYLCTTRADATDTDSWAIVTVHAPAQNDPSITLMKKLDLSRLELLSRVLQDLALGDWSLVDPHDATCITEGDVGAVAASEAEQDPAIAHHAVAALASHDTPSPQTLYLTWATSSQKGTASKAWCVRVVGHDLSSGKSTVVETKTLDLLAYLSE